MKRSRSLVLTTLIASSGVALTACDGGGGSTLPQWGDGNGGAPVEAVSYASVAECTAAGTIPAADCKKAAADAQAANAQNAPKFEDQRSCEERFGVGQCEPRNASGEASNNGGGGTGSFFTPLLTGFLVGQALNNFGGGGYRGAPLYRDNQGNFFGGAGNRISRDYATGRTRIGSDAFNPGASAPTRVQSRSSVISRGGFGGGGGRGFGG